MVKPDGPAWDLSAFGHVEARVTNTGTLRSSINLRVDNEGDWTTNPWNAEALWLGPGETGTVLVRFGYSFGSRWLRLNPKRPAGAGLPEQAEGSSRSGSISSPPGTRRNAAGRTQRGALDRLTGSCRGMAPARSRDGSAPTAGRSLNSSRRRRQSRVALPPAQGPGVAQPAVGLWT